MDGVQNDYEIGWRCNHDKYGNIIYNFESLTETDTQYQLMFNHYIKRNNKYCDEECMIHFPSLRDKLMVKINP